MFFTYFFNINLRFIYIEYFYLEKLPAPVLIKCTSVTLSYPTNVNIISLYNHASNTTIIKIFLSWLLIEPPFPLQFKLTFREPGRDS